MDVTVTGLDVGAFTLFVWWLLVCTFTSSGIQQLHCGGH